MRIYGFLILAAVSTALPAQPKDGFAWRQDDSVAASDPSRASEKGFGAMMLVTADADQFLKAWAGPTPPNLSVTDAAHVGKPVEAMLIFSGCKAKANGNCEVVATFSMLGPDGKSYGDPATAEVWGGPPPPDYNLQLSSAGFGFELEPKDAPGSYRLRAAVTDTVAGVTLHVEQTVNGVK